MTLTVATAIAPRLEGKFAAELAGTDDVELVRRCADVAEVLSAAEAGFAEVVALSADFPGTNGSLIAELAMRGATVLAVVAPTSVMDARQFESWGVLHAHIVGSGELGATLRELESSSFPNATTPAVETTNKPPVSAKQSAATSIQANDSGTQEVAPTEPGKVITVWGPPGSPGRTTTAINLAWALAHDGSTLVIDADTQAPSCAPYLGLLDEAPGVLAAARLADAGTLNATQLRALTSTVDEGFDVLSGIGVAGRWAELGRFHMESLIEHARSAYKWIVIDVSASYEADESLMYDTVAPLRHAATICALESADMALAVTASEPVALQRFVQHWPHVKGLGAHWEVVVSKARSQSVGGNPADVVAKALKRFAGVEANIVLPHVPDAMDAAALQARIVCGLEPDGDYARSVVDLARTLGATAAPVVERKRLRLPRVGRRGN